MTVASISRTLAQTYRGTALGLNERATAAEKVDRRFASVGYRWDI